MDKVQKKQVEKIITEIRCSKDFKCYKSGLTDLCKVRDIGYDSVVECLEEKAYGCEFRSVFGYAYYCKCPLRVYILKKLKL